jgi:hypothetical protein
MEPGCSSLLRLPTQLKRIVNTVKTKELAIGFLPTEARVATVIVLSQ